MMQNQHIRAIIASLIAYTHLPLWRWFEMEKADYERAALWWPLIGLLTGGLMALVYTLSSLILPPPIGIVLAILSRILLTGAFHEDGLGDFFDGFGGGRSREQVLRIMKDSHIGSYGTIAFVLYYLLLWLSISHISPSLLTGAFLLGDLGSKYLSSFQIRLLPYARAEEESKLGVVYASSNRLSMVVLFLVCLGLFFYFFPFPFILAVLFSIGISAGLITYIYKRIGGYTGDCCGAIALMTELAWYLALSSLCYIA